MYIFESSVATRAAPVHGVYYSSFLLTLLEKGIFPNITSSSQPLQKCKISLPLYSLAFILLQFTCGPAGILIGLQSNIFCSDCGRSESFDTTGIRSTFWSCRAFSIAHQWPEAWQWKVHEHSKESSVSKLGRRKGASVFADARGWTGEFVDVARAFSCCRYSHTFKRFPLKFCSVAATALPPLPQLQTPQQ